MTQRDTPPPIGDDGSAPPIQISSHFEQPDVGHTSEERGSAVLSGLLDGAAVGLFLGMLEMLAYPFTTLSLAATLGIAAFATVVSMAVGVALRIQRVGGTPDDVIARYGDLIRLGGASLRLAVHTHYDVDAAAVLMTRCGAQDVRSFRAPVGSHPLSVPNFNASKTMATRV